MGFFVLVVFAFNIFFSCRVEAAVVEDVEREVLLGALRGAGIRVEAYEAARIGEWIEYVALKVAEDYAAKQALRNAALWSMVVGRVLVPVSLINFVGQTIMVGYDVYQLGKTIWFALMENRAGYGNASLPADWMGNYDLLPFSRPHNFVSGWEYSIHVKFDVLGVNADWANNYDAWVSINGSSDWILGIGFTPSGETFVNFNFTPDSGVPVYQYLDGWQSVDVTVNYWYDASLDKVVIKVLVNGRVTEYTAYTFDVRWQGSDKMSVQWQGCNVAISAEESSVESGYTVPVSSRVNSDITVETEPGSGLDAVKNSAVSEGLPEGVPDNWTEAPPETLPEQPSEPTQPSEPESPVTYEPLNLEPLKLAVSSITNKFPFSLPWDFVYLVGLMNSEPVAPVFVLDLPDPLGRLVLDFSIFDDFMEFVREVEVWSFAVVLVLITPRLIGGAR